MVAIKKFPYVSAQVTRHGRKVYYFRKRGLGRRIRLPGEPGSAAFATAYQSCVSACGMNLIIRRAKSSEARLAAFGEDLLLNLEDILVVSVPVVRAAKSGIYFLIEQREIVYVGQSEVNVAGRILQHIRDEGKTFDHVHIIECPSRMLGTLERLYIERFNPRYSIALNPKMAGMQQEVAG